jgi:peptide/nickel transport system permease protein
MKSPLPSSHPVVETWRRFRKHRPALQSLRVIVAAALLALCAPIIANEKPWYVQINGQNFFPAFSHKKFIAIKSGTGLDTLQTDQVKWREIKTDRIVFAPVVYSPSKSDYDNANFVSPFAEQKMVRDGKAEILPLRYRHWLGTGARGNDLLAGLIHGTRVSLTVGVVSMGLATVLGLFIGLMAGFWGDQRLTITRGKLLALLLGIFVAWFYSFYPVSFPPEGASLFRRFFIIIAIMAALLFFFNFLGSLLAKLPRLNARILLPVDSLLSRLIEIFVSLPVLLLIIIVAAVSKPSLMNVMAIIGFTTWTGIARLIRAEMLRIRQLDYIQAAEALGYSSARIIFRHALPNAFGPALVAISIGVANAILIESSLSFLGIGVAAEVTTWGSLINAGRQNLDAWWMVVFPGLSILITVLSLNLIGEGLRDALDPRLRR